MSTFGDGVRRRRNSAQLRQTDFVQFGITQSRLSMIENDTLVPSPEKIEKIALALRVTALDLVGGTKLESAYLAARFTADEAAVFRHRANVLRSERMIAVQEAYRRVVRFFEVRRAKPASSSVRVDDEVRYEQTLRILRGAIDAAHEYEGALGEGIAMPPSISGEPDVSAARLWNALRRSTAVIASLVVAYPEADEAGVRIAIAAELGLDRIDAYLVAGRPLGSVVEPSIR